MTLPLRLPFRLGEATEFRYGKTAGAATFPADVRSSAIGADVRTYSIEANRRTA